MLCRRLLLCFTTALGVTILGPGTFAAQFRIETKVYAGDDEVPVSQNTTLFQSGVVYDFAESPKRVAILRQPRGDEPGRFVLIDPVRHVKTELTTDRIDAAIGKLRSWAERQPDPLLRFAANPTFEESFDEETGVLVLDSRAMQYRLATQPIQEANLWRDLRNYFDGYAKLNCILSSSMPPTPRLQVNQVLEGHNVIPVEVTLTLSGDEDTTLRAEHLFTWRLSKDDRARIALVGEQLVSFQDVSNSEFRDGTVANK